MQHITRFLNLARQGRWSDIRYQLSHYRYAAFWILAIIGLVGPWLRMEWQEHEPAPPARVASSHIYAGMPVASIPLTILQRTGYVVGYDEQRHNPAWVAYHIPPAQAYQSGNRPDEFELDSATRSKTRHEDYTNTGYDRGHMAPNYAITTRYGRQAQLETFLMSNVVPQKPDLNRGPWRELEMEIAGPGGFAKRLNGVWVITGPVYDEHRVTLRSGIEIPDAFYKIVIDEIGGYPRALGFIMPQNAPLKAKPERYLTSVDEIERQTGLDFLSQLDDTLEQRIESATEGALW